MLLSEAFVDHSLILSSQHLAQLSVDELADVYFGELIALIDEQVV
jgi:hypothetical protein